LGGVCGLQNRLWSAGLKVDREAHSLKRKPDLGVILQPDLLGAQSGRFAACHLRMRHEIEKKLSRDLAKLRDRGNIGAQAPTHEMHDGLRLLEVEAEQKTRDGVLLLREMLRAIHVRSTFESEAHSKE